MHTACLCYRFFSGPPLCRYESKPGTKSPSSNLPAEYSASALRRRVVFSAIRPAQINGAESARLARLVGERKLHDPS